MGGIFPFVLVLEIRSVVGLFQEPPSVESSPKTRAKRLHINIVKSLSKTGKSSACFSDRGGGVMTRGVKSIPGSGGELCRATAS